MNAFLHWSASLLGLPHFPASLSSNIVCTMACTYQIKSKTYTNFKSLSFIF